MGLRIEQLAEKSTFIEVSYLLLYGELPTEEQLAKFTTQIQRHTMLHEDLKRFFDGFPRNAHPMPVLSSAVNAIPLATPHFVGAGIGSPACTRREKRTARAETPPNKRRKRVLASVRIPLPQTATVR